MTIVQLARPHTYCRNVLITGASSGIGAGLARVYARRGQHVVIAARRADRLGELKSELLDLGAADVRTYQLDVTDPQAVNTVFSDANQWLGSIDRVIVNAGIGKGKRVGTGGFEANRQTIQTNVLGALAQCEAAMQIFYARGSGHLVIMSSSSAVRGQPGAMNAYAASKAAVAALAEGIRADTLTGSAAAIRVTCLFPGKIASEMTTRAATSGHVMSNEAGCKALAAAIERAPANAYVPVVPWAILARVLKVAPLSLVSRHFV